MFLLSKYELTKCIETLKTDLNAKHEDMFGLVVDCVTCLHYLCISTAKPFVLLNESVSIWSGTVMLLHVTRWRFDHCTLPPGTGAHLDAISMRLHLSSVAIEVLFFW